MKVFAADLHIHTVLSPCADLEMSPSRIVKEARAKQLKMIAVTDHNHTGHAALTRKLGERMDVWVVFGAEVNTREEVHCLTFFDTADQLGAFQNLLDSNIPMIRNVPDQMGDQVLVDGDDRILGHVEHSLFPGLDLGIQELEQMVHELGGLFVPAHVDRPVHGLYAQLGIFPENLKVDAVELSIRTGEEDFRFHHPELKGTSLIRNSDAHFVPDIGKNEFGYLLESRTFRELGMAFRGEAGRKGVRL